MRCQFDDAWLRYMVKERQKGEEKAPTNDKLFGRNPREWPPAALSLVPWFAQFRCKHWFVIYIFVLLFYSLFSQMLTPRRWEHACCCHKQRAMTNSLRMLLVKAGRPNAHGSTHAVSSGFKIWIKDIQLCFLVCMCAYVCVMTICHTFCVYVSLKLTRVGLPEVVKIISSGTWKSRN